MINFVSLSQVAKINPRPPKDIDETQVVTFLPMAAVSENGYVAFEEKRILSEVKKGFTYFEKGDFLIAKITPCFENGKAALTCDIENSIGYGSTEFHVIRPIADKLDKNYLYYLLWNEPFRFYGKNKMRGAAGQKRVTTDLLKDYKIPLPPLKEQKRIAAILDKADAIRRKRQQAIDLTDQLLRSVFLEMFGDPVTNPKGWKITALENTCRKVTDGTHHSPKPQESGVHYVTAKHVKPNRLNFDSKPTYISEEAHKEIYARCNPELNDVLYIKDGATTGIAAINPFDFEFSMLSSLALIKVDEKQLLPEFLCDWLNFESVKERILRNISGAAITRLTIRKIKDIKIELPPIELQEEYCKVRSKIMESKLRFDGSISDTENLFSSLTQQAFNGELSKQAEAA